MWFGVSAVAAKSRHHLQKASRVAMLAVVSLALLGLPATSSPASASSFSDQIAAAKARQASLRRDIDQQNRLLSGLQGDAAAARSALAKTGSQLDGINADQAQVKKEIKQATKALAKVQARRAALQDQLQQLDMTLDMLEQEIQQGSDELDARRAALGARLADAYRSQGTSLLEQVIDSGSFTDVVSNASAYLAYGDQDAQLAAAIAQDQASLDSLRAVTAATRYRTDLLRQAQQDAAVDLKAQKAVLAAAKAKLHKLEKRTKKIQRKQLAKAHQDRRQPAPGACLHPAPAGRGPQAQEPHRGCARGGQARRQPPGGRQVEWWWQRERTFRVADRGHGDPGVRLHRLLPRTTPWIVRPLPRRASTSPMRRVRRSTRRGMGSWPSAAIPAAAWWSSSATPATSPRSTATSHGASCIPASGSIAARSSATWA